ncbi:extracellular solute-binding protein [Caproiciproducens sp. CPB-2]|uniref:extracellular solute-binding protein n=1 Tax=Caproiciproducens sp. CPB-2 TaxID=3030017 RepID=UPI0023DBF38E|nr:extracellular solute-binding protein [Caproiciproducens sp. CPB-2]MDF1495362.1 extracellular solute-binding protein [Caproiciproducens sp. CPB-2]
MMKKIIAAFLAIAMAAGMTACGSQPASSSKPADTESQTAESQTEAANGPVTLKFGAQADSTPATQAVVDAFNSSQTKYKVEWEQFTNDSAQMHDQLLTSLSSGSSDYDVISLDVVWAGEFAAAGYLSPLDVKMSEAGYKKTDFNKGSMDSGNYQGKQYTLPFFPDVAMLYYRSDIVSKEDGEKLVGGSYTYDDLYQMAAKYKGQKGAVDGYAFQAKQYEGLTCNANEFTANFKDIKGGLQMMNKFIASKVAPSDVLNYNEGSTDASFKDGKSVFSRNWPYQYGLIKAGDVAVKTEQVGIAPLPEGGCVGGWLLGMNAKSKNADGAWEFIKYLAGPDGQKIMSTKGSYLPGYNAVLKDEEVIKANPLLTMEGFQKALNTTIARPVSAQYSKTSDTIQIQIHKYLSGSQDVDTTEKAVQDALK